MTSHGGPAFSLPGFTKFSYGWLSRQHGKCAELELDLVRCQHRAGKKMDEVCWRESEDMQECMTNFKQFLRAVELKKQLNKQEQKPSTPPLDTNPRFK